MKKPLYVFGINILRSQAVYAKIGYILDGVG